jgi:hypothetical protein
MTSSKVVAVSMLAIAAAITPAAADSPRYVLQRIEGGLIRMDTATGALSQCSPDGGVWRCRSLSDGWRDLKDEIATLKAENNKLKARVAELEKTRGGHLRLPSDAEINRLMGMFETMVRRFMDFARSLDGGDRRDI